ncbi:MAG: DUF3014 domain-containing protein [Pseudomonadota bacterium]
MRADPEDQIQPYQRRSSRWKLLAVLVVCVIVGTVVYRWWSGSGQGQEAPVAVTPAEQPAPVQVPAEPVAPDIPRQAPPAPDPNTAMEVPASLTPVVPALPDAEASNAMLFEEMTEARVDNRLQSMLDPDKAVDTSAALIDGMSRGYLVRKLVTLPPLGAFQVDKRAGRFYMSENGYRRYDAVVESLEQVNTSTVVSGFHSLRPLYERAYEALGLDPEGFDNAVIRTLDQVLATPELDGPIELESDSALYTYVDPKLESLTDLQKQLLRMGPDNTRRIKAQAQRLRDGLLARPTP